MNTLTKAAIKEESCASATFGSIKHYIIVVIARKKSLVYVFVGTINTIKFKNTCSQLFEKKKKQLHELHY